MRTTAEVTIASGAALSSGISLPEGFTVYGIIMPSGWTAAALTFGASLDGGTSYSNLFNSSGTELQATVAASQWVPIDLTDYMVGKTVRVRSGTSAVPVNQLADRTLTLLLKKVD